MTDGLTTIDVTDETFETAVLAESRRRPVVVDFWAPWCGPCRVLGPVLEKLAREAGGKWLLAKVNTDRNQEVAHRYRISGIPAVKAFRDGAFLTEFVGVIPEAEVRRWLDDVVPGPLDTAVAGAVAMGEVGRTDEAIAAFQRVLEQRPRFAPALLGLAFVEATTGRAEDALRHLDQLSPTDAARHEARAGAIRLRARAALAGDPETLQNRLDSNPADHDARLALGRIRAAEGRHDEALALFLEIVRKVKRRPPGDDARVAMLEVFDAIGTRAPLSEQYRDELAKALYS